ncbi:hypothetical protein HELRODRAFT_114129 [Helobdella robusta]|uniref:Acyl-coenzyme A oxidase n=1 Tax=Helobdella robusta TaxID=6412 RepID=T1EFZ3_HELRO|nr:hypothetical protein HELRODRAFT_114129 [Helobdella robusta]ESN97746.1 hypothetical protein HELRODRAFT_114129 [Helobdella robusta]
MKQDETMKVKRYDDTNVNPDFVAERKKCTFNIELLTNIIDGSSYLTETRRQAQLAVLNNESFSNLPDRYYASRDEAYAQNIRKSAAYIKLLKEDKSISRAESYFMQCLIFPNEVPPFSLHTTMFTPTFESMADEEQKKLWMPRIENYEILGTYIQTEMGHGTNVRGLETTATFDPSTDEFIIHSPTLTSIKWWPGGLGKTCNCAIVMASLITNGRNEGIHPFIVQLRDFETHEPLKGGLTIGDIGTKLGFHGMDNGFVKFDQFRIPRRNMLMKSAKVTRDGTYQKEKKLEKLKYGSMVFVRAMLVFNQAGQGLAQAVTIAARYSCVRRQSEYAPGQEEPHIIEYQAQQHILFTELAASYIFYIAGNKLRELYFTMNYDIQKGDLSDLPELHALSAGLKALTLDEAVVGIERCRLICGGHGYSAASGIPKIYTEVVAACTYEGVHPVLYLQTARYLLKVYQAALLSSSASSLPDNQSSKYIFRHLHSERPRFHFPLSFVEIVEAFERRALMCIEKASKKLDGLLATGRPHHEAWNYSACYLIRAAKAHSHVYLTSSVHEQLETVRQEDAGVYTVLGQLFELYALKSIVDHAVEFIESCGITTDQINICIERIEALLLNIRPNVLPLVDAFDFPDRLLGSALGCYDGNVYQRLYEYALNSPLNKSTVNVAYFVYYIAINIS